MTHLAIVSLLWAFSFGLIGEHLAGVDSTFVAAVRLGLSLLLFLPLLRPARIPRGIGWRLVALGTVQYGLMYVCYIESYAHLAAHEVALMTAMTPLHVVLIDGALRRRVERTALAGAGLAALGAALTKGDWSGGAWVGVALIQVSNLCFALGQVLYARWCVERDHDHGAVFALMYVGGFTLAAAFALTGDPLATARALTGEQVATLAYLGLAASGLGFFLWNVGATRVGPGTLAVFNNVKAPLAVLVALTVFGESAHGPRLLAGSLLIGSALALTLRGSRSHSSRP